VTGKAEEFTTFADYVKAHPNESVTLANFLALIETLTDIKARQERSLADLHARVAALESRPELTHRGTWRDGANYRSGSLVTKGGGLWLAERNTVASPGSVDSGWRLVVKSGHAL
jgi:hypothetical protein